MGIEGENGGYKYKAFINGEWHEITLSDSPDELTEWFESNKEWARVKHGHWTYERFTNTNGGSYSVVWCSNCQAHMPWVTKYCPNCGAKMDEVKEDD